MTKDHLPDGDYDKWLKERDSFLEHLENSDNLVQYESKLRVNDEPKIYLKYQHRSLHDLHDVNYHLAVDLSELGLTIKNPEIFAGRISADGSTMNFVLDVPPEKVKINILNFLEDLDAVGPQESLDKFNEFKVQMLEYLNGPDETVFSKTLEGFNEPILNLYYSKK